jgi:hypothetical protein
MEGVGMGVEIAITVAREETRVAVLDGGVVTDLFGDRAKHKDFVGNIYKGKVAKVLPGMQAAFVDIGLAKAAFMHVSDLSLDSEPGDTLVDADEDDKDADKDGDMLGPRRQSSKPIEQLLSEGQEQPRGATMDSDGTICVPAIGVRKADPHSDLGALLFAGAAGGLVPTSGAAGAVGVAGAASDSKAARSRERVELFGDLCRDVADGRHAVEGSGCHSSVFVDVVSLRLGDDVGVIA